MTDNWWSDVDDATLTVLAAAGGMLTLAELARRLGMSEDAVRSVVAMLAERGSVRITAVELARPRALARGAGRAVPRGGVGRRRTADVRGERPAGGAPPIGITP